MSEGKCDNLKGDRCRTSASGLRIAADGSCARQYLLGRNLGSRAGLGAVGKGNYEYLFQEANACVPGQYTDRG
jgi:hypothetical protein